MAEPHMIVEKVMEMIKQHDKDMKTSLDERDLI